MGGELTHCLHPEVLISELLGVDILIFKALQSFNHMKLLCDLTATPDSHESCFNFSRSLQLGSLMLFWLVWCCLFSGEYPTGLLDSLLSEI